VTISVDKLGSHLLTRKKLQEPGKKLFSPFPLCSSLHAQLSKRERGLLPIRVLHEVMSDAILEPMRNVPPSCIPFYVDVYQLLLWGVHLKRDAEPMVKAPTLCLQGSCKGVWMITGKVLSG
jgi:hypothetical protein